MDSSFFEYRDKTGVDSESDSESDSEVIDVSLNGHDTFSARKKFTKKNQTVFVAESDDSTGEDTEEYEVSKNMTKSFKKSNFAESQVTSSSDEEDTEEYEVSKNMTKSFKKSNFAESQVTSSSDEEDTEENEVSKNMTTSFKKSSFAESQVTSSSDEESSKKSRSRTQPGMSWNVVVSSSDESNASPEIVPRRRPPVKTKSIESSDTSFIGRKVKKRMMLLDSDTENSIVIENERHKKMTCLKDTPLKINEKKTIEKTCDDDPSGSESDEIDDDSSVSNDSDDSPLKRNDKKKGRRKMSDEDESESETDENGHNSENSHNDSDEAPSKLNIKKNIKKTGKKENKTGSESDENGYDDSDQEASEKVKTKKKKSLKKNNKTASESDENDQNTDQDQIDQDNGDDDEEEEIYEDQLVMSRATRMSIMGIIPKNDESDDSDYIQSDDSNLKSRGTSLNSAGSSSLTDLPDPGISITKTPQRAAEDEIDSDSSEITCSPFGSPGQEVTIETYESPIKTQTKVLGNKNANLRVSLMNRNLKEFDPKDDCNKVVVENKENVFDDDDVVIIDSNPEIIALSSDDEDVVVVKKSPVAKKSPRVLKKSPKTEVGHDDVEFVGYNKENTIKQYLAPNSYPNQIVYVKKNVKENELNKLNSLREDLQGVRYLLDHMDLGNLPDGGAKLVERLSGLESQVRAQGDKVGNMVVEPAEDIANDGFNKGLSWDELQKASNAVQPRMFGKQAMSTHMHERNLILDRLRDLHEALGSRPPESKEAEQPKLIKTKLMKHQLHALAWLTWRETHNPAGGILADDMGLGKTITMIALVACDKEKRIGHDDDDDSDSKLVRGGTLVVCPASLLSQWAGEVASHAAPHALSVCQHHGARRTTQPHRLAHHDLVLTTYCLLLKEGALHRVRWRRVILDEAHVVRNHKAATSLSVCSLSAVSRWCLTGTPVQNKDLDLFALLKFLRCTPFDELTMWKKWIDNKSIGGQERLSAIMRTILLRRTKQQLQQRGHLSCLPERDSQVCEVTLTKEEMNVYQKVLVFSKTLFAQFLHQRAEQQAESGGALVANSQGAYAKMHKKMQALHGTKPVKSHEILVLLLRLRQVCCHCGLIAAMLDPSEASLPPDPADQDLLQELHKMSLEEPGRKSLGKTEDEDEVEQEATSVNEALRSVMSPNNPVFKMDRNSSKISAVMDCLQKNVFSVKGEKAVVVSQWTSVLRLVSGQLSARQARHVTLDGRVPVSARQALVNTLNDPNSDVKVMLLSLSAGGVGLNLCGANHLLLLDPHWNPQLEEQAQDRIYRVGQTKHVHIYRFMCVDTVEQSIRKLQLAKLELADNVLTGARNNNASKLTIEDLKTLFNMGQ